MDEDKVFERINGKMSNIFLFSRKMVEFWEKGTMERIGWNIIKVFDYLLELGNQIELIIYFFSSSLQVALTIHPWNKYGDARLKFYESQFAISNVIMRNNLKGNMKERA